MVSQLTFNPANFSTNPSITNKYLSYTAGTVYDYEIRDATTGEIIEYRTVTVLDDPNKAGTQYLTKSIAGVNCIVVQDVVTDAQTGQTIEIALDYFAQDKAGNVWYFGEDVKNFKDGKFLNTDGSWLADNPGAAPGIAMEAKPKVNDTYNQENAPGVAEDFAVVKDLSASIGGYNNLLLTNDVNPLDLTKKQPTELELKYYKSGTGEVYSTTSVLNNKGEYVPTEIEQLVSVTQSSSQLVQAMASFGATQTVSSPVAAVGPDQHALNNMLATPGHHT
jgi:hypothetical protein